MLIEEYLPDHLFQAVLRYLPLSYADLVAIQEHIAGEINEANREIEQLRHVVEMVKREGNIAEVDVRPEDPWVELPESTAALALRNKMVKRSRRVK